MPAVLRRTGRAARTTARGYAAGRCRPSAAAPAHRPANAGSRAGAPRRALRARTETLESRRPDCPACCSRRTPIGPLKRWAEANDLISAYDYHSDGTGNAHAALRRPPVDMRPDYQHPLLRGPHPLAKRGPTSSRRRHAITRNRTGFSKASRATKSTRKALCSAAPPALKCIRCAMLLARPPIRSNCAPPPTPAMQDRRSRRRVPA